MIHWQAHQPLDVFHTFGLSAKADWYAGLETPEDLVAAFSDPRVRQAGAWLLGGGSNVVLPERVKPVVLQPLWRSIELMDESDDEVVVAFGAGLGWQQAVEWSLNHGLSGLENLTDIPGHVGAAPIQNIGAYGVELASVCVGVTYLDLTTFETRELTASECAFGYRDSVFKHALAGRACITRLTVRLSRTPRLVVSYGTVAQQLAAVASPPYTARDVSRVVRQIRASKLPDPRRTGNAGSFFKNPIVPVSVVEGIRERYPACPAYPVGTAGQEVKLAAGWLIEHAGLKGYRHRGAGVHSLQALVLVNLGHATQTDILELAITVRQRVFDTFGVVLEPEVWLYDSEMKPIVLPGCTA